MYCRCERGKIGRLGKEEGRGEESGEDEGACEQGT
jgi:hypothetical protein